MFEGIEILLILKVVIQLKLVVERATQLLIISVNWLLGFLEETSNWKLVFLCKFFMTVDNGVANCSMSEV